MVVIWLFWDDVMTWMYMLLILNLFFQLNI